jgi:hypothetical protein
MDGMGGLGWLFLLSCLYGGPGMRATCAARGGGGGQGPDQVRGCVVLVPSRCSGATCSPAPCCAPAPHLSTHAMPAACLSVACPAPAPRLHPPAVAARARARARVVGGSGRGAVPALGEAAPDAIVGATHVLQAKRPRRWRRRARGAAGKCWCVLLRPLPWLAGRDVRCARACSCACALPTRRPHPRMLPWPHAELFGHVLDGWRKASEA